MALSKEDMVALLNKALELIDTVIQELPDDNGLDDWEVEPISLLVNSVEDIQMAIDTLSEV
jgi:hypothetical protein